MMNQGIIQTTHLEGVPVTIDLIPLSNHYARPANEMSPTSITIHETGNINIGADAKAHTDYVDNVTSYVSWHFSVDDSEIFQELPINENAWHAGDGGNGEGNRNSIAIEICVNQDGDFELAKENTKKLVQYLMRETRIKKIYPHKHWSGKNCPRNILASGWDSFLNFLYDGFTDEGIHHIMDSLQKDVEYHNRKVSELKTTMTLIKQGKDVAYLKEIVNLLKTLN